MTARGRLSSFSSDPQNVSLFLLFISHPCTLLLPRPVDSRRRYEGPAMTGLYLSVIGRGRPPERPVTLLRASVMSQRTGSILKASTATPRSTPSPLPLNAIDVVPLVSTWAVPLLPAPAEAPA